MSLRVDRQAREVDPLPLPELPAVLGPECLTEDPIALIEIVVVIVSIFLCANGVLWHLRAGKKRDDSSKTASSAVATTKPGLAPQPARAAGRSSVIGQLPAANGRVDDDGGGGAKGSARQRGIARVIHHRPQSVRTIQTLQPHVLFRILSTAAQLTYMMIEITSACVPSVCTPVLRTSDYLQAIVCAMTRLFLVYRASKCVPDVTRQKRILKYSSIIIVLLFVKTAVLFMVFPIMTPGVCDIEYPKAMIYYMAAETATFDVILASFLSYRLWAVGRAMAGGQGGRSASNKTLNVVFLTCAFNLSLFVIFVLIARIADNKFEHGILVHVNEAVFCCSVWYGECILNVRKQLRRWASPFKQEETAAMRKQMESTTYQPGDGETGQANAKDARQSTEQL